jgi:hypothetical protein
VCRGAGGATTASPPAPQPSDQTPGQGAPPAVTDTVAYGSYDRRWLADKARRDQAAARRPRAAQGPAQPALRDTLADFCGADGQRLTPAELTEAVELWNQTMRGIEYRGPHRTAVAILSGTFGHSQVPAVPPFDPAWLAPLADGPRWDARSWLTVGQAPPAGQTAVLVGYDINGAYLSAAATDLGTGPPERHQWPGEDVLKLPGWVRVSSLEGAPHGIESRWVEGQWMPCPLAAYLAERGAQFLTPEALVWSRRRRWLDPHVRLMRDARASLIGLDTPAARAVLTLVKELYTRMFGGLLRSDKHNHGPALNLGWADQVPSVAQARMLRGVDTARGGRLAGVHVDAAWWWLPVGWEHVPGLIVSSQLGKWKAIADRQGRPIRVPATAELVAAYHAGKPETLRKAIASGR